MSILVVGSVAFDDVTSPSGSVNNILGGAATYFALAASYFTKVRVVAVVGDDFGPEQERVFHEHGIDTAASNAPKARRSAGAVRIPTTSTRRRPTIPTSMYSRPFSPAFPRNTRTPSSFSWQISSPPCKPMCAAR